MQSFPTYVLQFLTLHTYPALQALAQRSITHLIHMRRGLRLSHITRYILDILILHPLIGVSRLTQRRDNTALLRNIGMLRRKGGRRQPMHGSGR